MNPENAQARRQRLLDHMRQRLAVATLKMKPKEALDAVADKVLAYRPKPKSKAAKRRKRRAAKPSKRQRRRESSI